MIKRCVVRIAGVASRPNEMHTNNKDSLSSNCMSKSETVSLDGNHELQNNDEQRRTTSKCNDGDGQYDIKEEIPNSITPQCHDNSSSSSSNKTNNGDAEEKESRWTIAAAAATTMNAYPVLSSDGNGSKNGDDTDGSINGTSLDVAGNDLSRECSPSQISSAIVDKYAQANEHYKSDSATTINTITTHNNKTDDVRPSSCPYESTIIGNNDNVYFQKKAAMMVRVTNSIECFFAHLTTDYDENVLHYRSLCAARISSSSGLTNDVTNNDDVCRTDSDDNADCRDDDNNEISVNAKNNNSNNNNDNNNGVTNESQNSQCCIKKDNDDHVVKKKRDAAATSVFRSIVANSSQLYPTLDKILDALDTPLTMEITNTATPNHNITDGAAITDAISTAIATASQSCQRKFALFKKCVRSLLVKRMAVLLADHGSRLEKLTNHSAHDAALRIAKLFVLTARRQNSLLQPIAKVFYANCACCQLNQSSSSLQQKQDQQVIVQHQTTTDANTHDKRDPCESNMHATMRPLATPVAEKEAEKEKEEEKEKEKEGSTETTPTTVVASKPVPIASLPLMILQKDISFEQLANLIIDRACAHVQCKVQSWMLPSVLSVIRDTCVTYSNVHDVRDVRDVIDDSEYQPVSNACRKRKTPDNIINGDSNIMTTTAAQTEEEEISAPNGFKNDQESNVAVNCKSHTRESAQYDDLLLLDDAVTATTTTATVTTKLTTTKRTRFCASLGQFVKAAARAVIPFRFSTKKPCQPSNK